MPLTNPMHCALRERSEPGSQEATMKTHERMRRDQLRQFAQFLEEHPAFSPLLIGEDAMVYGFQVGNCFLMIHEMEALIACEPHFDAREAERLLAPSGAFRRPPELGGG